MEPKFTVAICGGGNLSHGSIAAIGHFNPGFTINQLTRRPNLWSNQIKAYTNGSSWESKGTLVGKLNIVSSNAQDVVSDADMILITSPAHTKEAILKEIKPYLKNGALVGTIFGQGAFDIQSLQILGKELISEKHLTIFSMQYVPFICKIVNYGKDINIIGPKRALYATSYPLNNVHYVCNALSQCYFLPCVPIPSFLNLTLCPSNQIIHPGRVVGFFDKFEEKCDKILKKKDVPLLYEDLDQRSADEIAYLDNEIQAIKWKILEKYPQIDLSQVMPIADRICTMYDGQISDKTNLKTIFNTNVGYSRVPFPIMPVEGQDLKNTDPGEVLVRLNLNARFFWEDLPYGLVILKDIGDIVGAATPNITRCIIFHQRHMPVKYVNEETGKFNKDVLLNHSGAPSAYGITTIEDLVYTSLQDAEILNNNIYFGKKAKL